MSDFLVVIPARMASTRLPGKPLVDIKGKPLLMRTWQQCVKAVSPEKVYVATDDQLIMDFCSAHGIQSVLTSPDCLTGTDRIAEFAAYFHAEYYINVQGDEPVINPDDITAVIQAIALYPGEVINGFAPILSHEDYTSLTIPKVATRLDGRLLYMSRSPIPGNKKGIFEQAWKQVCVYAFPKACLSAFSQQKEKTPLEQLEDLEMLRFLELGYDIRMIALSPDSIAVDTPKDIDKVVKFLEMNNLD